MTTSEVLVAVAVAILLWPSAAPVLVQRRARPARPMTNWRPATVDLGLRARVMFALAVAVACAIAVPAHAAACAGVLTLVILAVWQQGRARKRAMTERARDADALSALAAELRAGHDLASALASAATVAAAELRQALIRASQAIGMGEPPADALDRGSPSSVTSELAGLVRLSGEHGVPLADVVDVLADDTIGRIRQRRDLAGLLAGPRATASLLAALPVFGIVMGESIGAHPLQTLLHTGAGAIVMLAGTALAATGVWWTQALVRSAES